MVFYMLSRGVAAMRTVLPRYSGNGRIRGNPVFNSIPKVVRI